MGRPNTINAEGQETQDSSLTQEQKIDLYIGIFFDGTNNNKYQTMLGKYFRRKEYYDRNIHKLYPLGVNSPNDILKHPRSYWENLHIFNKSELDNLFFGYIESDNNSYNGQGTTINGELDDSYFMENKMLNQIKQSNEQSYDISSLPEGVKEETIGLEKDNTEEVASKEVEKIVNEYVESSTEKDGESELDENLEGDFSQGATYTNVAILEAVYNTSTNQSDNAKERHYSIYIEGSGSNMEIYPKKENEIQKEIESNIGKLGIVKDAEVEANLISKIVGLAFGNAWTGVMAKTRKVANQVYNIIEREKGGEKQPKINLHFDLFGFSRGATAARAFNYAIDAKDGNVAKEGFIDDFKMITGRDKMFLSKNGNNHINGKKVRFLGIYDTVSSIGVINNKGVLEEWIAKQLNEKSEDCKIYKKEPYHEDNVKDYGLYATDQANKVFHICALDEVRQNFALVDIQQSIDKGNGIELFLPGCHTDIGGGITLGREETYVVNLRSLTGVPNYICIDYPYHRGKMNYKSVTDSTLIELGWLKDTDFVEDKTWYRGTPTEDILNSKEGTVATKNVGELAKRDNIIMQRYVKPGYSNVSLHLMRNQAEAPPQAGAPPQGMFKEIPSNYAVPQELKDYFEIINKSVKAGRTFVHPDKDFYSFLRKNYLHFSANDQILSEANNLLVNPPEYLFCDLKIDTNFEAFLNKIDLALPNMDESTYQALLLSTNIAAGTMMFPGVKELAGIALPIALPILLVKYWEKVEMALKTLVNSQRAKIVSDMLILLPRFRNNNKNREYLKYKNNCARISTRVVYKGLKEKPQTQTYLFDYNPKDNEIIAIEKNMREPDNNGIMNRGPQSSLFMMTKEDKERYGGMKIIH